MTGRITKAGRKMKRIGGSLAVLAVTTILVGLNGCGTENKLISFNDSQADQEVEEKIVLHLSYAYMNSNWSDSIEQMVLSFEKIHPEIDIVYETNFETTVYEDTLTQKIARDELDDIIQLKSPEAYIDSGLFGEISNQVAQNSTFTYEKDGQVYAIGAVETTWGILYNKKIFERYGLGEPETYEEFLQACNRLSNFYVTPIGLAGGDLWHLEYWANHFFRTDVMSSNSNWLEDCAAGETAWTDPESILMLRHLSETLSSRNINSDWISLTDSKLPYIFAREEVAMIYTGPWTAQQVSQIYPELDIGWFYLPDSQGDVYAADNQDTYWAVSAECQEEPEKYQAAMAFLEYFYTSDNYAKLCNRIYSFSSSKKIEAIPSIGVFRETWDEYNSADYKESAYIGDADCPSGFEKAMLTYTRQMIAGEISVEEAAARIQESWDELSRLEVEP